MSEWKQNALYAVNCVCTESVRDIAGRQCVYLAADTPITRVFFPQPQLTGFILFLGDILLKQFVSCYTAASRN